MTAAGQSEVCAFIVDGASEERLSAAAVDFAGDVLLPDHLSIVRIDCPDESLLLRCNEDLTSIGHPRERGGSAEVPVGTENILRRTVLRRVCIPTSTTNTSTRGTGRRRLLRRATTSSSAA